MSEVPVQGLGFGMYSRRRVYRALKALGRSHDRQPSGGGRGRRPPNTHQPGCRGLTFILVSGDSFWFHFGFILVEFWF